MFWKATEIESLIKSISKLLTQGHNIPVIILKIKSLIHEIVYLDKQMRAEEENENENEIEINDISLVNIFNFSLLSSNSATSLKQCTFNLSLFLVNHIYRD